MSSGLPSENKVPPSSRGVLRWGLLGCAQVTRRFAADLRLAGCRLAAVASRSAAKAEGFAREFGLPRAHGSYEALLGDSEVDIVYIALPNALHAEWSMKALRAGKHVLCEKPAALSAADMEGVLAAARAAGRFFLEGFAYRFHPYYAGLRGEIAPGVTGGIRLAEVTFSFDMGHNPADIRQTRDLGGGALLDVGCYCLSFLTGLLGPVAEARAVARIGAETGVDEAVSASLGFASGALASFQCGLRQAAPQRAVLFGPQGRIEVPSPWHPHREKGGFTVVRQGREEWRPFADGLPLFARQALQAEEAIAGGLLECAEMPWGESLETARLLGEIRREWRV